MDIIFQQSNHQKIRYDNARIYYNKYLQHVHIECGDEISYEKRYSLPYYLELTNQAQSPNPQKETALKLQKHQALHRVSSHTRKYELTIEHSDECPNKLYQDLCSQKGIDYQCSKKNANLAVCLAIIDDQGRLLVTRRNKRIIFPHAWVMPGGGVEIGESLEEAVVREAEEETGFVIRTSKDKDGQDIYHVEGEKCELVPFYAFESAHYGF